jgi:hypothetical protein
MQLISFRIQSFRSINDTSWCDFSPDGVNVLVGQNESGKTSILEALYFAARHSEDLLPSSLRSDGKIPSISIKAVLEESEIQEILEDRSEDFRRLALSALKRSNSSVELETSFSSSGPGSYGTIFKLVEPVILPGMTDDLRGRLPEEDKASRDELELQYDTFVSRVVDFYPYFSLFKESVSNLPDTIRLEGQPQFRGQTGAAGARNFIEAAQLDVVALLAADDRVRSTLIKRANAVLDEELGKYWTQYLGNKKRISIEAEFSRYPPDHSDKAGVPYLSFWVSEGDERFYPSQRSRGTRWFVSVFLHLLATERSSREYVVMLDEPGSFLHATAQDDVKRLIERISEQCPVIYSTHSPDLVDFSKPYRVLAAERSGPGALADTEIFQAMKLICASTETLGPILSKMGADLRHQAVIKSKGNVLLEEPSAHFYLKAFERILHPSGAGLSFIAASGVNNVPTLFAMFLGWGLKFAVLLDDDKQAREVRKDLVKNYFGDVVGDAEKVIFRLNGKAGIEDLFSRQEFFSVVLNGEYGDDHSDTANSAFMKLQKISKPVAAYRFFLRTEAGDVKNEDFSQETLDLVQSLFDSLKQGSGA